MDDGIIRVLYENDTRSLSKYRAINHIIRIIIFNAIINYNLIPTSLF